MKTISSLIASSTIGIAAAGLSLGKQEFSQIHKPRSTLDDLNYDNDQLSSLSWRPGTSFTNFDSMNEYEYSSEFTHEIPTRTSLSKSHRRPPLTHRSRYALYRRPPSSLKVDRTSSHEVLPDEDRTRESISSRSSWIRRLSSRAGSHSQQGTSLSESSKTAPTNYRQPSTPRRLKKSTESLPRNRLVKKIPRVRAASGSDTLSRSGKKLLTIQRPVTSHQRKLLLQQQPEGFGGTVKDIYTLPLRKNSEPGCPYVWRQYFDSRINPVSIDHNLEIRSELPFKQSTMCNRAVIDDLGIPTLVKPKMIFSSKDPERLDKKCQAYEINITSHKDSFDNSNTHVTASRTSSGDETSTKLPHRSLSMHFTSPISRLSRSGSFRGFRSKVDGRTLERNASVLTSGTKCRSIVSANGFNIEKNTIFDQNNDHQRPIVPVNDSSSPQLSLSRFSTLSIDLARIGLSSSSSSSSSLLPPENSITQVITKSHSCLDVKDKTVPFSPNIHENLTDVPRFSIASRSKYFTYDIGDRASTLIGSDLDTKGFTSCDEYDTDFRSETVFDSMRSGATGIIQATKPPLEFIFDDSSIFVDDDSRLHKNNYFETADYNRFQQQRIAIAEDDYTMKPPNENCLTVKRHQNFPLSKTKSPVYSDKYSPHISIICLDKQMEARSYPLDMNNDYNEEEEDWTKDEIEFVPEEKMKNGLDTLIIDEKVHNLDELKSEIQTPYAAERPKTNVFDWSEPSSSEKLDKRGISPRPRTAHVKQLLEVRCGRVLGRRGPSSLHIRSQSVPVAPDTDASKITSKFGTWGLSSKVVREDWDGDFEFDSVNSADIIGDKSTSGHSEVQVPEAIKANQENIVGHVSQIREVCLLVEDLKRLRALGKAQGLLGGAFESLWLEAEGIIALAAPAEDGEEGESEKLQNACSLNINYNPSSPIKSNKNELLQEDLSSDLILWNENQKVSDKRSSAMSICPEDESWQQTQSISAFHNSSKNSIEGARKVMESIHQQRSASDPLLQKFVEGPGTKMPFDTTSLKDLVNRAAALSRTLGQVVRSADNLESISQTRPRDSSPAFTRMFTDPMILPSRSSSRRTSKGSTSKVLNDISSLEGLPQHMKMMTVT
ncbi:hypothetical protein OnM2_048043 [Erysiphe neolycopersici]|uniref:Uncharacterized protein n=1 Tax=Erysiphe neolycopersici TaxID=212602 RepID=A0A420HTA4_9PEZI|nr:hypothetical protein OnM2_048043 [Erysiphe neolycopersici]